MPGLLPEPNKRHSGSKLYFRPKLESLEDRTTPSAAAYSSIAGHVVLGGSTNLGGINLTLTGATTTGQAVDLTTSTDINGSYAFTLLTAGSYTISRQAPTGFQGGTSVLANISLGAGESLTNENFSVAGLAPSGVSLAYFLSTPGAARYTLPTSTFSLDSATPLSDQFVSVGTTTYLDLSGNFLDPSTTNGTMLAFNTSVGTFDVELFDKDAPQTVTNFLNYVEAGAYTDDVFHRLSNLSQTSGNGSAGPTLPYQILQAGGFTYQADTSGNVTGITALGNTFQPILNEFNASLHSDVVGTLAMAKGSDPNSATSQFFFNLVDNSAALGASNTGGFTVFAQVVGTAGTTALTNLSTNYTANDESTYNSAFGTLPLVNGYTPNSSFPTGATTSDLAVINNITVVQPPTGQLSYKIISNSNPSVVSASFGANTLSSTFSANQLQLVANSAGTATITVQVTDSHGQVAQKSFNVTAF